MGTSPGIQQKDLTGGKERVLNTWSGDERCVGKGGAKYPKRIMTQRAGKGTRRGSVGEVKLGGRAVRGRHK